MNPLRRSPRHGYSRGSQRGFTLTELMAVVAIVGILAVLGVASFRKHALSSKSVEAYSMIQSIRAAQERWRAETQGYLDVSTSLSTYYPMTDPGTSRYHWVQSGHVDFRRWQLLNPTVGGPVQFGYAVIAGLPGTIPPQLDITNPPTFQAATEAYYVIQAEADADGDGAVARYAATSFSTEIYAEREGE